MIIPLTQGKVTEIDDADYVLIQDHKWRAYHKDYNWYARTAIKVEGRWKDLLMHRLIMNAVSGQEIDHIDRNSLNNRRSNLRFATKQENQFNRRVGKGSSIYKGVYWQKSRQNWRAVIRLDGKLRHLGNFFDEKKAALAYNIAASKLFGTFANLNII